MKWAIDTSVAVKWFAREEELYLEQSDKLLDDLIADRAQGIITDILIYELANVFIVSKKLLLQDAQAKIQEIFKLNTEIVRVDDLLIAKAMSIAAKHSITVYDATFIAAAYFYNAALITDNPKHHRKISEVQVVELKDYPVSHD